MGPRVMADPRHHGCFNQKLVGGLEHLDYFHSVGNVIILTDELIFFKMVKTWMTW